MKKEVMDDLKSLTTTEMAVKQFERNCRGGGRPGGIGWVRVDRTNS